MKFCPDCNTNKEFREFYKRDYGYTTRCKVCHINRQKLYTEKTGYKIKSRNKPRILEYNKFYYRNHVLKFTFKSAKYRAAKLKRTPHWLTQEHWKQIEAFYIEAKRLTQVTGIPHEVDHIVPLQGKNVSGLHVPWNLQILTESQNCSKNNLTYSDMSAIIKNKEAEKAAQNEDDPNKCGAW